jgi:signal transduction histidine kinase
VPQKSSYTLQASKVVCRVVLIGSYLVVGAISVLALISFILHHTYAIGSLIICVIAFLYLIYVQLNMRQGRYHIAAYLLALFFGILATEIVWSWGINTPIGTLLLSLVIVLSGILLSARHALYTAMAASCILISTQLAITLNWHTPDMSWSDRTSNFGDTLAYSVIFGMLGLISWLYNREMERSLAHAVQAETALSQQKATLKLRVEERTAELQRVQLAEMQQMYRFAELGQHGIVLLHDLANHVTALTLEIEGLQAKQQTKAVSRAREIIRYLEKIVNNTRERLNGDTQKQTFDVIRKTSETIDFLGYKASEANVEITWQQPTGPWNYTGDPTSYCQVIAIIASNAIDAYHSRKNKATAKDKPKITITTQRDNEHITIKISDWGNGVSAKERKQLFKPHHSTKKSGLGLGLYIAKQTVELQFSGTITINPRDNHTEFIIKLPLTHER